MVVFVVNILVVKKHLNEKYYGAWLGISALFIATEILWMIFDKIGLFVVAQVFICSNRVCINYSCLRHAYENESKFQIINIYFHHY